jgi:hypothetical protein
MQSRVGTVALLAWAFSAAPALAGAVDSWGPNDNTAPVPLEAGRLMVDVRTSYGISAPSLAYPVTTLVVGLPFKSELDVAVGPEPYAPGLSQVAPMFKMQVPVDMGAFKLGAAIGGTVPLSASGGRAFGGSILYELPLAGFVLDGETGFRQDLAPGSGGSLYFNVCPVRDLGGGFWGFLEGHGFIGVSGGPTTATGRLGVGYMPLDWIGVDVAAAGTQDFANPGLAYSGSVGLVVYSPR